MERFVTQLQLLFEILKERYALNIKGLRFNLFRPFRSYVQLIWLRG